MPPITSKMDVARDGLLTSTKNFIVNHWEPADCESLEQYKESLATCLRSAVPRGTGVEIDYKDADAAYEIHLAWQGVLFKSEVAILMKCNIAGRADLDELVLRVIRMQERARDFVVVFCGLRTKRELVDRFYRAFPSSSIVVKLK